MRRVIGFIARAIPRIAFVVVIFAALTALPAVYETSDSDVVVRVATVTAPKPLSDIDIDLKPIARVPHPTALTTRRGDRALYIASKKGQVYSLRDGDLDVALDIEEELSFGFEQGLLGVAFTPDGSRMVVNFTNTKDSSVTRAYNVNDEGKAVAKSGRDLLVVPKPEENHNAGNLVFGPDDYLYMSLGDGGESGDPHGNAQSKESVLGKILRLEVLPDRSYKIPPGNPFVDDEDARAEIWAYGFRNPWRFSFDRRTGDLWIADVGRDTFEEINRQPAAAEGGRNYGWHEYEGPEKYVDDRLTDRKELKNHVPPVHWYKHDEAHCAAVGGFVYRGSKIRGLEGAYLFTDFCAGGISGIRMDDDRESPKVVEDHHWPLKVNRASSFGQDAEGELYLLALDDDVVYRIVPAG